LQVVLNASKICPDVARPASIFNEIVQIGKSGTYCYLFVIKIVSGREPEDQAPHGLSTTLPSSDN
jgi:hypothetical protein